jgi:hypothetical protein
MEQQVKIKRMPCVSCGHWRARREDLLADRQCAISRLALVEL